MSYGKALDTILKDKMQAIKEVHSTVEEDKPLKKIRTKPLLSVPYAEGKKNSSLLMPAIKEVDATEKKETQRQMIEGIIKDLIDKKGISYGEAMDEIIKTLMKRVDLGYQEILNGLTEALLSEVKELKVSDSQQANKKAIDLIPTLKDSSLDLSQLKKTEQIDQEQKSPIKASVKSIKNKSASNAFSFSLFKEEATTKNEQGNEGRSPKKNNSHKG